MLKFFLKFYTSPGIFLVGCSFPLLVQSQVLQGKDGNPYAGFKGYIFYDVANDSTLASLNVHSYFTPASNIKILTLLTSIEYLNKNAPSIYYTIKKDSLIFKGTGNPAFLHSKLKDTLTYKLLKKSSQQLYYYPRPYAGNHFGPGWAWEDYKYYFAPEKAVFPIYGNVVNFKFSGGLQPPEINPGFFYQLTDSFPDHFQAEEPVTRALYDNQFYYEPQEDSLERNIPFRYSNDFFVKLLEDTLKREINLVDSFPENHVNTFYSISMDSIYKEMMHESDNFLAEQLLLMCSSKMGDSLHSEKIIDKAKKEIFKSYPDSLDWVDGSGLSRYNLLTPQTIMKCLKAINRKKDDSWLFTIFPTGGEASLEDYPKSTPPFMYAKTGSLGGVHCLSGYFFTLSGKKIIFSYMVNNFVTDMQNIRDMIYRKILEVRNSY